MRRSEPAARVLFVIAAAAAVLAVGCSSRPSYTVRGETSVAPEYNIRSRPQDRRQAEAALHLSRADRALATGDLDAAAAAAREALRLDAKSADALTILAFIEQGRGRPAQAGEFYRRAAEAAPGDVIVLNNYGAWLCGNGRAVEAMGYFDRVLSDERHGRHADTLANSGTCAAAAGQPDRTERDLRVALRLDPENALALSSMAEYQYRIGQFFEARAFSQRRLAAAPATAGALRLASQIEEALGDKVNADRYRQQLGTEFPGALSESAGESSQP